MQVFVDFDRRRMVTIFPECSLPLFTLVVFLGSASGPHPFCNLMTADQ